MFKTIFSVGMALFIGMTGAAADMLTNGGFEVEGRGWSPFWARETNVGQANRQTNQVHSGQWAMEVRHRGERDWCVNADARIAVEPGQIYELEGWAKVNGDGDLTLAVILYDANGQALSWAWGGVPAERSSQWQHLKTRFVIPKGAKTIVPRWMGYGAVVAWLDDTRLRLSGGISSWQTQALPPTLAMSNAVLEVTLQTADGTLNVRDRRSGRSWSQRAVNPNMIVCSARLARGIELDLFHVGSGLEIRAAWQLDGDRPELTCSLTSTGALRGVISYPHPFVTEAGTYLVVPMNEGISYPVEDESINPMRLIAYGGHGICMGFWGVTDGAQGQMAIMETPDDAVINLDRHAQRLYVAPEWEPQKRQFGYPRTLRYVFFDRGGHVAMCKRYRQHAKERGLLKTLAEKRADNPNVDLLIGAVNVWCWDRDSVPLVRAMREAGIERILWSNQQTPDSLRALNELGVLTSRYDIYQDVMNPENFKFFRWIHPDWVTEAWPNDVIYNARGDWIPGWEVKGTNGLWYPCGVICDRQAPPYAARRIPAELATHPYKSRFIDTTTAAPWHECYHTNHPMTRTESREWKMKLLQYVSRDCKLVTGCETGHDASVPYLHYFEGMLSLGPYRVPDSGRDMLKIWDEVPEPVAKFQLGHAYRLPLWELVYHDCVVAQWYWGDYNNKLPALWRKRDLFNLLYGTPPMFMFTRDLWEKNKARFVESYQTICPTVRRIGYAEMTDHRFLTPDRAVQETVFANGTTIVVNFGEKAWRSPSGAEVPALGFKITP